MSAVRTIPAHGRASATIRLREVGATLAKRLMIDRQVEFWAGEIRPAWSLTEVRARVVDVIDETHDVKTFVLAPNRAWRGHLAGQYVPVDVEIDGKRVRRCYSISSAPGERRVAITVKRVAGGRVSTWMHERIQRGHTVVLGAPAGEFVLPLAAPSKLLFLSGGSGVTPAMSILRDLAQRDELHDVTFVHCARSPRDVIFAGPLKRLAASHPGLRLVIRHDDDAGATPLESATLRALVPDLDERLSFLCGPEGMMRTAARAWEDAGIGDRLRCERFVAPRAIRTTGATESLVHLSVAARDVVARGPGTLLEQLERGGERPSYGCRMGICNTCRCRKRSGVVEDVTTGVVSDTPDEDIRLCVSIARSDLDLAL